VSDASVQYLVARHRNVRKEGEMRRPFAVLLTLLLASSALAGDRVPGERWLRYVDPAEAGFDRDRLQAARRVWESLPSSAFLVVADGAVVASWGEPARRFMCHSVRKSFLSALYGIYWDRGKIDLDKTLADLGIDDTPAPLLPGERQARIIDLLKARSGVFHPAAYAGRTDSRPRGSEGPGRFFAYNNWDFNTLATILEEETGARVFEAFDEHFARPLGMQDFRVSDGYYHYERDKSRFPAYPFRMSTRDAARFGLLFAREGRWGSQRLLSRHWVRRSTVLYSTDDATWGYGLLWWVAREPRFERHGMFAALGVGNQMVAVLPDADLVIVNRADTYHRQGTPTKGLLDLVGQVLEARVSAPAAQPRLVPLEGVPPDPWTTTAATEGLSGFAGRFTVPPPPLGLPAEGTVSFTARAGHLVGVWERGGTFAVYLQPDGTLRQEDSGDRLFPVRGEGGTLTGVADAEEVARGALAAAGEGRDARAREVLALAGDDASLPVATVRAVVALLGGDGEGARRLGREAAARLSPPAVEATVNRAGYQLLQTEKVDLARRVFELNTELFPDAFNTWDSLGEACVKLGRREDAVRFYERSLALNAQNRSAREALEKLGAASPAR
jgi:CubicO group peptidase (beta-lactamase class C family)